MRFLFMFWSGRRTTGGRDKFRAELNMLGNLDLVIYFSRFRCHGSAGTAERGGLVS